MRKESIYYTEDKKRKIFMYVCVLAHFSMCLHFSMSKSRVPCDWFSLCFPHSHHQRETWWSWIQLRRLSPDTTVIKQTEGEEMRTSTPAAASALSSIAPFPSCQFFVDVRDVCTKTVWMTGLTYQAWVIWHLLCAAHLRKAGLKDKYSILFAAFSKVRINTYNI